MMQANIIMDMQVWFGFFNFRPFLIKIKIDLFFVRISCGYSSHQHCYHMYSCRFFLMQLEVRVKISRRSSAKKRSTEHIFWFKMASSLRLVGRGAKFFHISCKFILIRLFGFRNGKKVNSQEFGAQQFIIATDYKSPLSSHRQRNFWNVWLTPVQAFQPNLKHF